MRICGSLFIVLLVLKLIKPDLITWFQVTIPLIIGLVMFICSVLCAYFILDKKSKIKSVKR